MRRLTSTFAVALLAAALASAQTSADATSTQVFAFAHLSSMPDFQNMANAVRTIVGTQQENLDEEAKSLSVTGTPVQLALAQWVFHALDVTPPSSPTPQEYDVPGSPDDVVRVFYLTPTSQSPRQIQEIVNAVRVITEIGRVYQMPSARAVCLRGSSAQVAASTWLVPRLDQPIRAPGQAGTHQFTIPGAPDQPGHTPGSTVSVFYLIHTTSQQQLQEVVNAVRVTGDITHLCQDTTPMAIAMRGHPEQVALAGFLIGALDIVPGAQTAIAQYTATGDFLFPRDSIAVRVFYLSPGGNAQDAAIAVRSSTKSDRVFPCSAPRAVVFRGTPEQAQLAEAAIKTSTAP
jgi:hypothetical protein